MTSDPNVVLDYSINPGSQGVNFQSNIPVTITYQFSCIVYIKYICIIGTLTNVNTFSYVITDINQTIVGQGIVTRLTSDQCTPRPLPTADLASQVDITIDETIDGQPPRNIVIDMQACLLLSVSSNMKFFLKRKIKIKVHVSNIIRSPLPFAKILTSKTFHPMNNVLFFLSSRLQLHHNCHCPHL